MSNGLQLFTSEDGTQILIDPASGRSYAVVEKNFSTEYINDHQFAYHHGNQPPHTSTTLNTAQNIQVYPQTQQFSSNESLTQYPNQMATHPNQIHTTFFSYNTQQNNLTRVPSQCNYQNDKASTPLLPRERQDIIHGEEAHGFERNETPSNYKRALNDSDEFRTVVSKGQRKKNQRTEENQPSHRVSPRNPPNTGSPASVNQNKYSLPLEQLQRAVAHNLPCFVIQFSSLENLPSAVNAAEELYEHFNRVNIKLNRDFSIVRYFGNHLKVGVKDKNDYQTLCNQNIWPKELNNKQITVQLPKFVPEQFSLVVRFVPAEMPLEQVESELKRSARTADNIRKIIYSYPRKTTDYRFTVTDRREYNGLLRLGHIGIGNRMRTITTYRPANKITYCSKCWKLGHLRSQCREQIQKCRICLLDYNENHNETCSKIPKCAQCSLEHVSIDPDCQVIQQYRNNLNKAVKQAMKDGAIKVVPTNNTTGSFPPPSINASNYPSLLPPPVRSTATTPTTNAWKIKQNGSAQQNGQDLTNHELLDQIKMFLSQRIDQVEIQIKEIKREVQENKEAVEVQQIKVKNLEEIIKSTLEDIIKPIINCTPRIDERIIQTTESLIYILNNQSQNTQTNNQSSINTRSNNERMDEDHDQGQVQLNTDN